MAAPKETPRVTNTITATVYFTAPRKPHGYGGGFAVQFAVAPKVGDIIEVDQYSIRKLREEELHLCRWRVVNVSHSLSLDCLDEGEFPLGTLNVTVHPYKGKAPK